MWPFKRNKGDFPKPEWPPIQNLDSVDVVGKRHDGTVELVIVASQPLDNSARTLDCISKKVDTYLETIGIDAFQTEMGYPPREKTVIILVCEHPIHPEAIRVIEECKGKAAGNGIRLELRKSMG
jgi:hypothetical protein